MRQIDNWDAIQETDGFERPAPGAYIARIVSVEDVEEKEYLAIRWDFVEGIYKGENQATFDRAGFWPTVLRKSYKEKALGFFKAFKTAVEMSNSAYTFSTKYVQGLVGKYMGVVLGEEEYRKNNGDIDKRLYVHQVRSLKAIRDGDFKVPELKKLDYSVRTPRYGACGADAPCAPYEYTDEDAPF